MAETVCITTWLEGDYRKGTLHIRYKFVGTGVLNPGKLNYSLRHFSTPEYARKVAKREGFTVLGGVAQGAAEARKKLGMQRVHWTVDHETALTQIATA